MYYDTKANHVGLFDSTSIRTPTQKPVIANTNPASMTPSSSTTPRESISVDDDKLPLYAASEYSTASTGSKAKKPLLGLFSRKSSESSRPKEQKMPKPNKYAERDQRYAAGAFYFATK